MQVGPEACEDVPPSMELCYYSNTRGKRLPTGSKRPKKVQTQLLPSIKKQYGIDKKRMRILTVVINV